ncbi:MAG: DEAD/DEAH box helicase [Acidimicrobiales bacterium]|nr:DEAD/DEAH box helicase [Acidimicrobiales bacterium]
MAAPTGSGKTVVAEHAVAKALGSGRRAFYTTPIKALSNQKYADLVRRHGHDSVGLLTGDNAVNGDAPVVVMTTEVLRNMIYAGSPALRSLSWVVLDEVHYLQDSYRGPVWEEVLIHAPEQVRFVCLSATVSNADELAGWIASARGETETVIEHERPVELVNHYLVHDRSEGGLVQLQTLVGNRPNPEGERFDAPAPTGPRHLQHRQRSRQRWGPPRRPEVVDHLAGSSLLPAIYFIFSRAACDDAARAVLDSGLRLTTRPEARRVREIVAARVAHLDAADLTLLGFDRWSAGLEAGVAAHHAGMVPPFKEAVEACFVEGLVKVVFATETLALGINMPARSVVIESLSKFTGDHHEDLTPSQYTQLTGRAGRRGLDPVGHALVLWSPWHSFDKVAALAASREFVLRSAFKPTYNMVVNLVRRHDRERAHELLGRSFAQYQSDRSVARLTNRRARRQSLLAEAEEAVRCELGDVDEYRRLKREERRAGRERRQRAADEISSAATDLVPGDVLRLRGHRLAVLSVTHRKGRVRVRVIGIDARVETLDEDDFDEPPFASGRVRLPEPFDPRDRPIQRRLTAQLRKAELRHRTRGASAGESAPEREPKAADLAVAACPDLEAHLVAAAERDRLQGQLADVERRLAERSGTLVKQFDLIHALLERRGFVDGWTVTERGELLSRIFHESDLLCAMALSEGLFDDLNPAEVAGLASMLTYEHRSKDLPPAPWFPSKRVRQHSDRLERMARGLIDDEEKIGLRASRMPDPTFLAHAHAWAAGESLDVVLEDELMSGGDFVRNIKTLIDLLRQMAAVAPVPATAASASQAAEALMHGVVAASTEIAAPDDPAGPA